MAAGQEKLRCRLLCGQGYTTLPERTGGGEIQSLRQRDWVSAAGGCSFVGTTEDEPNHSFFSPNYFFMKKHVFSCLMLAFFCGIFSFSGKKGGDMFAIFLNGKQVHQQFVHADKSVKTLTFRSLQPSDKIEVLYSHCGHAGTNRVLAIRDAKNNLLKKFSFGDGETNMSRMGFYQKDVAAANEGKVSLFYSSTELPEGRLLATIVWNEGKVLAGKPAPAELVLVK